jgi:hypothetical protein
MKLSKLLFKELVQTAPAQVTVQTLRKVDATNQLNTYDSKYIERQSFDVLGGASSRLAVKAEKAVDNLFFTYVDEKDVPQNTQLVTVASSELNRFSFQGQQYRRLSFDKNSLALRAL